MFGIGFVNSSGFPTSLIDYPDIELGVNLINEKKGGEINKIPLIIQPCDPFSFLSQADWNNLDTFSKTKLFDNVPFYLCPDLEESIHLTPYAFNKDQSYIELYVKAKNLDSVKSTLDSLRSNNIRIEFIWSDVNLQVDNKYNPHYTYINFFRTNIHSTLLQKVDMFLNSIVIQDDDNLISSGYNYFFNEYSIFQPEGAVFRINDKVIYTEDLYDRSIIRANEENLYFSKITVKLSGIKETIQRSYQKFTDFLAGMTALSSNLLFLLILIMSQINDILGKNILLKSIFSQDIFDNMIKIENGLRKENIKIDKQVIKVK